MERLADRGGGGRQLGGDRDGGSAGAHQELGQLAEGGGSFDAERAPLAYGEMASP